MRLKVLEQLVEPDSAAGLSRRLGVTRQVVNYHLRALEDAGVVAFVEERRRGGLKERVMRATARSYVISPEAMGAMEPDTRRHRGPILVGLPGRRGGEGRPRPGNPPRGVPTASASRWRRSRSRPRSASPRLTTATRSRASCTSKVAELAVKYHDEQASKGRLFRFVLGAYPAITKTDEEAAAKEKGRLGAGTAMLPPPTEESRS